MTGSLLLPGCRERTIEPGEDYARRSSGLWVPPDLSPPPRPKAIGLFSGAGGMDLGFEQAGFDVVVASDGWDAAMFTYLVNMGGPGTVVHFLDAELPEGSKKFRRFFDEHRGESFAAAELAGWIDDAMPGSGWLLQNPEHSPLEHYYLGDVTVLTGEMILRDLGMQRGEIDCVQGGPPCQGFSVAGHQDPDDPRNELVFEFMRVVCEIHPRTFCMENVPGIVNMVTKEGIPVLDALALQAEAGGMGSFEALRASLAQTAGVGAAVKGTRDHRKANPRSGSDEEVLIDEDDGQLDLFGGDA